MSLEAFTGWIKDLVQSNPTGLDPKSQGDDHLRGIKKTLLDQFSGFTQGKAITVNEDQVNSVVDRVLRSGDDMTGKLSIKAVGAAGAYVDALLKLIADTGLPAIGFLQEDSGQSGVVIFSGGTFQFKGADGAADAPLRGGAAVLNGVVQALQQLRVVWNSADSTVYDTQHLFMQTPGNLLGISFHAAGAGTAGQIIYTAQKFRFVNFNSSALYATEFATVGNGANDDFGATTRWVRERQSLALAVGAPFRDWAGITKVGYKLYIVTVGTFATTVFYVPGQVTRSNAVINGNRAYYCQVDDSGFSGLTSLVIDGAGASAEVINIIAWG